MFDIGFLELFIVMVIALMVIGPERMPEVARKVGKAIGKVKSFIDNMKENSELSSTIKEMKESINMEEEKKHIEEMRGSINNDISNFKQDFNIEEEISRPDFGNELPDETTSGQFNKAPSQPQPDETIQDTSQDTNQKSDKETQKKTNQKPTAKKAQPTIKTPSTTKNS
jgi:sec-independent protein translocase protein TatB